LRNASAVIAATVAVSGAAYAQADFYKGKTIEMIISTGVGGGLDTNARMVARYLSKHIPGNPTIVAKNMPGAGHVRAANYIYNQAPKDGTTIGTLIPAFVMAQVLDRTDAIQFDAAKMNWLASTSASNSTVYVWKDTGVNTVEDAKKKSVVMGGTGAGSYTTLYPLIMNHLLGTQFKIVSGYNSTAEVRLAMERGEVQGKVGSTWGSLNSGPSEHWVRDKIVTPIVQLGLKKAPDIPAEVPLGLDLAKTPEDRQVLEVLCAPSATGYPSFMGPGVPKDRVDAIRAAYVATMKDPEFAELLRRQSLDLDPIGADELTDVVRGIYAMPEAAVEHARELLPAQ
jgi:tripartite-type tricarboxylate transporter receptor subunit TctC